MKRRVNSIFLTISIFSGLLLFLECGNVALADDGFTAWLENFYPVASKEGISRKTWDTAFLSVTEIDSKALKKANYQPEFKTKIWDYLDARVNPLAVGRGNKMSLLHADTLTAIEKRFSVPSSVLLAIWSMESNYGAIFDKPGRLHYVPRALATLAYKDTKRRKFASRQLIAALKILQNGDIQANQLTGSWAGAMGHTQFIPTSYLAYGVDMDNDGARDIWNSVPDALATAANLLVKNGWQAGKTWGYEVKLVANASAFADETKSLSEWQELGFRRTGGRVFPRPGDKAVLKLLAGENGPGFLMLKNFFVFKRYNNADSYALAVGLLADRIAGYQEMQLSWPRPKGALTMTEKVELQQLLGEKGFYQGEVDGFLGPESRAAIRASQQWLGQTTDGEPTKDLLVALRRKMR